MINFDNSATSFPKPAAVARAVSEAVTRFGGNPGRGGHKISEEAAQKVFEVRSVAAEMFGAQVENVAFTQNCTYALNMAIKGIAQFGGHIIISDYEHNAVARPVYALWKTRGVRFSVAKVSDDDDETVENFRGLIEKDTRAVVCTLASNVTGRILPYKKLADLCKAHNICFIGDGAQACGVLDVTLADGFDFLCTAGHKALYGPTGTGLLISNGAFALSTIIEGGTGTNSAMLEQAGDMPEKLESGTLGTVGIIGLGEGLRFVRRKKPRAIFTHEMRLCEQFAQMLAQDKRVKIYEQGVRRVPVVAFNIGEMHSEKAAQMLSQKGFALRGGLQCAALAHRTLGTLQQGVVRFSPSAFSESAQVSALARAIYTIKE